MFLSWETWTLVIAGLILLYIYETWPYGVFKNLGIPGPRPLPFLGTVIHYRKGFFNFDLECMQKYGKMWGVFDGRKPVLGTVDTTLLKTVLVRECLSTFTNRRTFGKSGILDNAITTAEDDHWKRIRSVLSPTFTSGRLKEMFPIIKHYADNLLRNIQKKAEANEPVQMKEIFGAYSMDVVASTSFSVDLDSLNRSDDPFVINIKKVLRTSHLSLLFVLLVTFPWLMSFLAKFRIYVFPREPFDFFPQAISRIKEKRKKGECMDRVDFLQLMVESQISDQRIESIEMDQSYKALTDQEILDQAVVFIFAGYETTSSTLSYMAYNLAIHPDVQRKLQQEIDETFPNKAPLTYDAVMQMEYLDMALSESQRLFPVAGRVERVCKKTVEINGVTIVKDMVVMVPLYALHRDPEHWPEPEEFRPERFSKENKESRDPYAYMPFGAGPRNCIGMRFALLTMKLALVTLLQDFSLVPCHETQIPLELDVKGGLTPKKPIILQVVPRTRTDSEE
ncbi:cytochrome P450 3A30-like [Protopterus annectens]|uniref:cytochrome P450 3A30-like n=1 Tax=Protopterus annectens TaxID=7888 RepID=UPI001CFABEC0|nr:cytochrome P450 3A30-like [Protopterus annectens]